PKVMSDWNDLTQALREQGIEVADAKPRAVGGGDISSAWQVPTDRGPLFLKTGPPEFHEIFSAEAEGLNELKLANAVRVPAVLAFGQSASDAYIALEWLDFSGRNSAAEILFGRQLALQHRRLD